jgi:hypothetical protein
VGYSSNHFFAGTDIQNGIHLTAFEARSEENVIAAAEKEQIRNEAIYRWASLLWQGLIIPDIEETS